MIEQTVEEIKAAMQEDPEGWAQLYLDTVNLVASLEKQVDMYHEIVKQQRVTIATFEQASLNKTH